MMQERTRKMWKIIVLLNITGLIIYSVVKKYIFVMEAGSIGIIGGVDGPTAVFITTNSPMSWIIIKLCILAIAVIIMVLAYIVARKIKR